MYKLTLDDFNLIRGYIKEIAGINISRDKMLLVSNRLSRHMESLGIDEFGEYYRYLVKEASKEELNVFVDKLTTNHTYFMREKVHFDIFDELCKEYNGNGIPELRVWCAASSSGEEPYTLAHYLQSNFVSTKNYKLLATDISNKMLFEAYKGIYTTKQVSVVPDNIRNAMFKKIDDELYQVKDHLKKVTVYRKFNLVQQSYKFKKKFHIIFCRNVMIYFDAKTKQEVIRNLEESLEDGGYLFISQSESLVGLETKLQLVKPSVYKKI